MKIITFLVVLYSGIFVLNKSFDRLYGTKKYGKYSLWGEERK